MLPKKSSFALPDGMIYLDGNSLGPLPKGVPDAVTRATVTEWGGDLIKAWNSRGWMAQPQRLGDAVGRLIGAPEGSVVLGDTLSIKVFQALSAALKLNPGRRIILSDDGNFPSDLYMAEGLVGMLDGQAELRTVAPEQILSNLGEDVAVMMLTEVDYRTGRRHDAAKITEAAHAAGIIVIWDLAHSAGALDVDLAKLGCEFAVGCTYKYLNGGPGAPAFIYVRPDLVDSIDPVLSGWLGHDAPFAFEPSYRAAAGIERMRVGTPSVLQMAALEAALKVWDGVTPKAIQQASHDLSDLFIREVEQRCPTLKLITPRDRAERGSQVSFEFENGYAAIQALIDRNLIGDFRAPNVMRFGITPLYLDETDVISAAKLIEEVISDRLWDRPDYLRKKAVT